MLELSPKGTVPVLVLLDGTVIDESIDIVKWACADEWAKVDHDLIAENDGAFKRALDRYKYPRGTRMKIAAARAIAAKSFCKNWMGLCGRGI